MDPSRCRRPDSEVDCTDLKRPSIRAASKLVKDDIVCEMVNYNICGMVEDDEVWQHDQKDVGNGMFGVEKAGSQVVCRDGKSRPPLGTIMHMKPADALQYVILGDIETLPHESQ